MWWQPGSGCSLEAMAMSWEHICYNCTRRSLSTPHIVPLLSTMHTAGAAACASW